MARITITFTDEEFAQLKETALQKKLSLGQYLRQLTELGLQVEAMTAKEENTPNYPQKPMPQLLNTERNLWEQSLLSVLESRYLIRYLVDNLTQTAEKKEAVLNAVKEKAQVLVAELLKKEYC